MRYCNQRLVIFTINKISKLCAIVYLQSNHIVHFVELYHGEYDRERLIYSLRAYEPKFVYAAGKAEKELRGVKRYVNLFYRIYNGRRKHEILPMKF